LKGIGVKPIKAAKPPNQNEIWGILVDAVKETNGRSSVKFRSTVASWNMQPTFEKKMEGTSPGSDKIIGITRTDNQIYIWVNDGTKGPYPIPKHGPGVLAFKEGFVPKTRPRVIASGPGGSFGDTLIRTRVMHPGIEARNFDLEIKDQIEPIFERNMTTAMKKVAKLLGK
jgi:hypothetical protein